jgi:hypothetical protein
MGSVNMNLTLKEYVNYNYPQSKSDLFSVFMESSINLTCANGSIGMINQHSWMFLPTYKKLREKLLNTIVIETMIHLGPRAFEELSGEVVQSTAFTLKNCQTMLTASFYRLVEYKNIHDKERAFLDRLKEYKLNSTDLFRNIPGIPIAYWVTDTFAKFLNEPSLGDQADVRSGIMTGNDKDFIRSWHEVSFNNIGIGLKNFDDFASHNEKWYPFNKGEGVKKWHPDYHFVLNFKNAGEELKLLKGKQNFRVRDPKYYFEEGVNWSDVGSTVPSFRYQNFGFLFAARAPMIFDSSRFNLGLLNSKVIVEVIKIYNPTLTININDIERIPIIKINDSKVINIVEELVQQNIIITETQDNERENSWNFLQSPFLNNSKSLKNASEIWEEKVTQKFINIHVNEEKINRIFINIYGLERELTHEVPLKDITILQDELVSRTKKKKKGEEVETTSSIWENLEIQYRKGEDNLQLPFRKDFIIVQFISYAIGLFMGRYRLDKSGLNIAHPSPTAEELANYNYNKGHVTIDEDAILPLMGKNCNFADDALQQINQLLDTIWGHETRTENTNFIQECLDKELEKFLVKDFYNYHCKMYKKKPIYWLFSSKTGVFQVLVYMHRMNAFTVEKIRANYMLEHLKNLRSEESMLQANASNLNTQEAKRLDQIRKDLVECEAYDMELKNVADQQISFDLDDGVTANYALFESVLAKIK